jgi:hypothetical protein
MRLLENLPGRGRRTHAKFLAENWLGSNTELPLIGEQKYQFGDNVMHRAHAGLAL